MSLTGATFLDGIIVLTVLAFIAVILIWPRLTRRTPWHVAGRVGALALVNVLVLLTAATQLNATYLFFSGWSDLREAISGHLAQSALQRGGDAHLAPDIRVHGNAAPVAAHVPPISAPVSSSGLISYTVHGRLSGLTGTVLVQLPQDYLTPAAATERYPVLEAFHGYPSSPVVWIDHYHLPQLVDQLAGDHQLRDPLIVMPQIEFPRGVDTEGVNGGPGQPQVETWLTRDVPDWIGKHFRVIADRNAWATIGYSAGAYDSAMATILHPAQYGAAIALGGYYSAEFGPNYEPFTATSPQGRRYDLSLAEKLHAPPVSLWIETSHADPVSYPSSAQFLADTRDPTAVHAVVLQDAGHRDSVWIQMLPRALHWLGRNIAGFEPEVAGGRAEPTSAVVCGSGPSTRARVAVDVHPTALSSCAGARQPAVPGRSAHARQRRDGHRPTRAAR